MAGRCSAALVEPPVAATTAAAFSNALRVHDIARADIISPAAASPPGRIRARNRRAISIRRGRRRRTGQRQADGFGDAGHGVGGKLAAAGARRRAGDYSSSCRSSASTSCRRECWPTPSKTSTTVTSLPLKRPGMIEPPYMKYAGTLRRSIAIIMPGRICRSRRCRPARRSNGRAWSARPNRR